MNGALPLPPSTCLHGLHRDNFTFVSKLPNAVSIVFFALFRPSFRPSFFSLRLCFVPSCIFIFFISSRPPLLLFPKFQHVPLHIVLSMEGKFNCTVLDAAKSLLCTSNLSYFFIGCLLFSRCVCTKLYVTYFSDVLMCRKLFMTCRVT